MTDKNAFSGRRAPPTGSINQPLVTPIYPSVAYRSTSPDALDAVYEGQSQGYTYAREGHPNADSLARRIDAMEGVENGAVTSSGMSAISSALLAVLKSGDHLIAGDQLYGRTQRLLMQDLPKLGVTTTLVDPTDAGAVAAAIHPETRAVLIEVVSNPTLRIADMDAIADTARQHALCLIVDNTFTTPKGFLPLTRGADVVVHSVTKLLAGHSDVTLGYVGAKGADLSDRIRDVIATWGLTPSPHDCWLAERGIYTFDLRFHRAQKNAAMLADHLGTLPGIETVIYPGRSDHADHARAARILGRNFGNIVSFRIKGGRQAANALTLAAPDIAFAPTLGDIGTTLSHPASSSHRAMTPEAREKLGISEGFFRVSVGIEDIDLLKSDFATAVGAASET